MGASDDAAFSAVLSPVTATVAAVFSPLDTSQPILASPLRPVRLDVVGRNSISNGAKPRLCGSLLKQRKGGENHWQLRHFEISSGRLKWWMTSSEKEHGYPPKNELDLQGLRMQKKSATIFELQTLSSTEKGRVYALDTDVKGYAKEAEAHDLRTWIGALEQEGILARRASQLTLGTTGGVSPSVSPRVGLVRRDRRINSTSSGRAIAASPSPSIGSSSMSAYSSPMRPGSAMSGLSQNSHRSSLGHVRAGSQNSNISTPGTPFDDVTRTTVIPVAVLRSPV